MANYRNEILGAALQPVSGSQTDYDGLMRQIGDAQVVLIGEASHGTHEFYRERARITQRLIQEKDFNAVAVEADWPDAYRVNRYVRGLGEDTSANAALADFKRFPTWMWRNREMLAFTEWLRQFNQGRTRDQQAGFYGLDLYSLHASVEAVIAYLEQVDPEAATEARYRYGCFDNFGQDLQDYGFFAAHGLTKTCEDAVVEQLKEMQHHRMEYAQKDGRLAEEAFFNAEQNARLAKNAERYYRSMFAGRVESWNLRDTHMDETLTLLMDYLNRHTRQAKVVVWAHNSHIGDARATEMGRWGELNIGQLARRRFGQEAFSIGFSTYHGTVTAASQWGEPAQRKTVRPGLPGSYENLFHQVGVPDFWLNLHHPGLRETLHRPLLERAIGVIYMPQTERQSHYFEARITEQFDALIHLDHTRALEPLEHTPEWMSGEVPETFPSAL